jgi:hypothetical protein
MTCGIDDILKESKVTLETTIKELMSELEADFDLDVDPNEVVNTPEYKELRGAMEIFTVWLVHGREKAKEKG